MFLPILTERLGKRMNISKLILKLFRSTPDVGHANLNQIKTLSIKINQYS